MGRGSSGTIQKIKEITALSSENARQLSDEQLAEMDKKLTVKIQEKKEALYQIAKQHSPQDMPQKYYDIQRDRQKLEVNRSIVLKEKAKRKMENKSAQRTAVNSFGEATGRYITSDTYERQQKRLARQIMKFIGG